MPHQPLRQPTLYIPHGAGPCFFMQWDPPHEWDNMAAFLRGLANTLPEQPSAIVMVSAHWRTDTVSVTAAANPALYYDYYNFPEHTYALEYPAPGEPELAQRLAALLNEQGISTSPNTQRGFDHGMFIPLKLMFPNANIPVVQLSLHNSLAPELHLAMGEAIAGLRDEGVLIIGSGMSFHNMQGYGDSRFGPISAEFDAWLSATVASPTGQRMQGLNHWHTAPQARQCHPEGKEEHLIPLHVAAGAAGGDAGTNIFTGNVLKTTVSAYRFG